MVYFLVSAAILSAILHVITILRVNELIRRKIPHRYTIIDQDYL